MGGGEPPATRDHSTDRALIWAAVVLASTPMVIAAVAAQMDGYSAWGDQAVVAMRSGDVLTQNTPMLGMPTGGWAGIPSNHLGPLLFWLLAPFVHVLGNGPGPLVGVATIGVASIVGIAFVARRHISDRGAAAITAGAGTVYVLTGGAGLLYRPVNPIAVFMPFVLFLVLSWAVSNGDRRMRPWWALVGSLVVQSDLAYVPVTVVVALTALLLGRQRPDTWGGQFTRRLRQVNLRQRLRTAAGRSESMPMWPLVAGTGLVCLGATTAMVEALWFTGSTRVVWLVAGLAALSVSVALAVRTRASRVPWRPSPTMLVLLIVWALPVLQQLLSPDGNVTALAEIGRSPGGTLGWRGARAAVDAIAGNPLRFFVNDADLSLGYKSSAALVLASISILAIVTIWAHRREHRSLTHLGLVACAALAASAYATANLQEGSFFSTHVLWLMPVTALFWITTVVGMATMAGAVRLGRLTAISLVALAAFMMVPRVVSPSQRPIPDGEYQSWQHRATPEIAAEVRDGLPEGHLRLLVAGGGAPWLKQLSIGLMAELETGPIDVATDNIVNYLGSARDVFDGRGVDASIWVMDEPVSVPPPGAVRILRYAPEGWDPAAVTTLAADIAELVDRSGGLVLSEDEASGGLRRVLFGRQPDICPAEVSEGIHCDRDATLDIDLDLLDDRTVLDLYRAEVVESPRLNDDLSTRLRNDASALPVSVWVGPAPASSELDDRFT